MAKSVISQSDELIKLQKADRRKVGWSGFLWGFLVVVIWFIWVLLAAFGKGYYGLKAPFGTWSWISKLPYPDMTGYLFDFASMANTYRLVIMGIVLVAAVLVGFFAHKAVYKKINRAYRDAFLKFLIEEGKINGLVMDYKPKEESSSDDALSMLNISTPSPSFCLQFSTPLLSWEGKQYTYLRDKKSRSGFLISTDLAKARTHAFIQLRTFGEPSIRQYQGLAIKKYGFGDMVGMADFVCFTSLGQDIYLVIDKKTAEALSAFYSFVHCDIIVTVIGDKLTLFLDGFLMSLTKNLKENLPSQILEQEAEALVALHQAITAISNAFSGEIGFAPEEKGNGIVSY
jgi:hypothetical protein